MDCPRDAHGHYRCFIFNLTETPHVVLHKLTEIQNFTLNLSDVACLYRFASKCFPLTKFHVLIEEDIEAETFCQFLDTFRQSLTHLVIRNTTDNQIKWPRLPKMTDLLLVGVDIKSEMDFLSCLPSLKSLMISQDRVTHLEVREFRALHTLTCLKIVEAAPVNAASRLSDAGLQIIFRTFPFLTELVICQDINSTQPTFSDEGITGAKLSLSEAELLVRPRDLKAVNRNLMRFSHFIGSLPGMSITPFYLQFYIELTLD